MAWPCVPWAARSALRRAGVARRCAASFSSSIEASRVLGVECEHLAESGSVKVTVTTHDGPFEGRVKNYKLHPFRAGKLGLQLEGAGLEAAKFPADVIEDVCNDLSTEVARLLLGVDPTDQNGVDDLALRNGLSRVPEVSMALSIATARAGAAACKKSLSSYIAGKVGRSVPGAPVAVMELYSSGLSFLCAAEAKGAAMQILAEALRPSGRDGDSGLGRQIWRANKMFGDAGLDGKVYFGIRADEELTSREELDTMLELAGPDLPIGLVLVDQAPGSNPTGKLLETTMELRSAFASKGVPVFSVADPATQELLWHRCRPETASEDRQAEADEAQFAAVLDLCDFASISSALETFERWGSTAEPLILMLAREPFEHDVTASVASGLNCASVYLDATAVDVNAMDAAFAQIEAN